jgi:hypothetical protein
MMPVSGSSRSILLFALIAVAAGAAGEIASACEACRQSGTTMFHREAVGGDDVGDAILPSVPPPDGDEGTVGGQFYLNGGTFPQPGGLGTRVRITYSYNNLLDGGLLDPQGYPLPASLIRSSIEEAFRVWASVVPLDFVEVPDEGGGPFLSDYPDGQYGEIRFSHVYINGPDIPGRPPVAKAMAFYHSAGRNISADVFFDHSDRWQEFGTIPQPDILGAAIHEIGHTLGLGHTDVVGANMYWIFHRFQGLGSGQLFPDDIAGIQQLYGYGVGSVTPLPIPEPSMLLLLVAVALSAGIVRIPRRRHLR